MAVQGREVSLVSYVYPLSEYQSKSFLTVPHCGNPCPPQTLRFLKNLSGHSSIVNCLAVNEDGVMVSGGDNGSLAFWDYDTGYCFQKTKTIVQPGKFTEER